MSVHIPCLLGQLGRQNSNFVDSIIKEAIRKRDVQNIDPLPLRDVQFRWSSFLFNRKIIVFNVTAITLGPIVGLGTSFHQELLETFYSIDWFSGIEIFSLGAGVESLKQILERLYKSGDK